MAYRSLRPFAMFAVLGLVAAGTASAEDCSGTITAEEAMKAEAARYAARLGSLVIVLLAVALGAYIAWKLIARQRLSDDRSPASGDDTLNVLTS